MNWFKCFQPALMHHLYQYKHLLRSKTMPFFEQHYREKTIYILHNSNDCLWKHFRLHAHTYTAWHSGTRTEEQRSYSWQRAEPNSWQALRAESVTTITYTRSSVCLYVCVESWAGKSAAMRYSAQIHYRCYYRLNLIWYFQVINNAK